MSKASAVRVPGSRKAAVLMAIMGEDAASAVYKHLTDDEVQTVTRELAEIGRIPTEVAQEILEEYGELALTQDYLAQGGLDFAKRLLVKTFGDDSAKTLLDRVVRLQELSA